MIHLIFNEDVDFMEKQSAKKNPSTLPFSHNWLMSTHQKIYIYNRLTHLFSDVCPLLFKKKIDPG